MSALHIFADSSRISCEVGEVPISDICTAAKASPFHHLLGAPPFAERQLCNASAFPAGQSALIPANLITLAHFSVSSAICWANCADEVANTVTPTSTSRAAILGSARPALISLWSFSTISTGVFLGATMPDHPLASKHATVSQIVGTSGSIDRRADLANTSARNLPALICSRAADVAPKATCT